MSITLKATSENIQKLVTHFQAGKIAAVPTETVYGLAGNATDPNVVIQIFETKNRPQFDPLIVHTAISSLSELNRLKWINSENLSSERCALAQKLIDQFWPGPLTLVLPKGDLIPELVTSGLPSVAVRNPAHPLTQKILAALPCPLAAPSANRFGHVSPTTAKAVEDELGDRIPFILDGGPCEIGVESTVLSLLENGPVTLLRPGGVPFEEIEKCIGHPITRLPSQDLKKVSPGTQDSHYSPAKPFFQFSSLVEDLPASEIQLISKRLQKISVVGILNWKTNPERLISFFEKTKKENNLHFDLEVISLSKNSDWKEVAKNLFSSIRKLDQSAAEVLLIEPLPEQEGLAYAIQDRINRASSSL